MRHVKNRERGIMAGEKGWKWDEEKILRALNKETGVQLRVDSTLESLGEKFSLLALLKPDEYGPVRSYLAEKYLGKGHGVIYITLNSGFEKLQKEKAWQGKAGKPFTIDMITKTTGESPHSGNEVAYLTSPLELTECMYELERKLAEWQRMPKCILLDSVSTMLIYNARGVVEKFIHNLAGKAGATGALLIVLSTDYMEQDPATRPLGQFFDAIRKI